MRLPSNSVLKAMVRPYLEPMAEAEVRCYDMEMESEAGLWAGPGRVALKSLQSVSRQFLACDQS